MSDTWVMVNMTVGSAESVGQNHTGIRPATSRRRHHVWHHAYFLLCAGSAEKVDTECAEMTSGDNRQGREWLESCLSCCSHYEMYAGAARRV